MKASSIVSLATTSFSGSASLDAKPSNRSSGYGWSHAVRGIEAGDAMPGRGVEARHQRRAYSKAIGAVHSRLTFEHRPRSVNDRSLANSKGNREARRFGDMELAGLEPATSWVRNDA
jgi:hypothetical protein